MIATPCAWSQRVREILLVAVVKAQNTTEISTAYPRATHAKPPKAKTRGGNKLPRRWHGTTTQGTGISNSEIPGGHGSQLQLRGPKEAEIDLTKKHGLSECCFQTSSLPSLAIFRTMQFQVSGIDQYYRASVLDLSGREQLQRSVHITITATNTNDRWDIRPRAIKKQLVTRRLPPVSLMITQKWKVKRS